MANVITYNQIIELLTDIARRHYQINTFYLGKNWELENSDDILYPLFQVYPDFGSLKINDFNQYKTQEVRFVCKVVDTTTPSEDNERDVHSDTLRIAQDIVNEFNQHPFYVRSNIKLIGDVDFLPLEEFKDDISAGWQFNLTFQILNLNTFCGMPIEEIPGFSATGPTSQGTIVDVKYLTCDTLTECPAYVDHETRIDALESEESDLETRVEDLEAVVFYQNQLISGGASFLSGLTFAVTDLVYVIAGQLYTANGTNVTINAGDPSFDRIDVIVADINGVISVVEGTPDANPVKPDIDETTQIEVTFINVPAGAVVIPIPVTLIYDENTGPAAEWTTSTNYPTGINFNATNIVYSGTKSIRLTNVPTAKTIVFTAPTLFDTTTQNTIQFAIRNNIAWTTTRRLRFSIQSLAGVQIGGLVDVYQGQYGFSSANITQWQIITIPISKFNLTSSFIGKLVCTTYSTSGTLNLNMDYFRMIVGTPTTTSQNSYLTIKDDAGVQTTAATPNSILTVSGGTNLTSVVTTDKVTLNLDPNISLTSAILTGATANTLTYFDGTKSLKSVTLGTGLSLVAGTLSATATVPTIAQVVASGNTLNSGQLIQGFDTTTYITLDAGFYTEFGDTESGFIFLDNSGIALNHSLAINLTSPVYYWQTTTGAEIYADDFFIGISQDLNKSHIDLSASQIFIKHSENITISTSASGNSVGITNTVDGTTSNSLIKTSFSGTDTSINIKSEAGNSAIDIVAGVTNLAGSLYVTSDQGGDITLIYSDSSQAAMRSQSLSGEFNIVVVERGAGTTLYSSDSIGSNAIILNLYNTPLNVTNNGSDNNGVIQDTISNKGLIYFTDYSANFTPESLVTKRYVDNALSNFDTLAEILANGNTTGANNIIIDTGQNIQASDGLGMLELDYFGSPGEISLSTDGGNQNESYLYLTPTEATLVGDGSSITCTASTLNINGSTSGQIYMRAGSLGFELDGRYNNAASPDIIKFKDNFSSSFTTSNNVKSGIIIGSQNSTINSAITNSVILGGSGITATTSNTVYVPSLNIGTSATDNTSTAILLKNGSNVVVTRTVDSVVGIETEEYFDAQSGTTVVLSQTPKAGKVVQVFRGGLSQRLGAGRDYTISGTTITFNSTLVVEDIQVIYKY